MIDLDAESFTLAQSNGTGFRLGMVPEVVLVSGLLYIFLLNLNKIKKKWQTFAVKYDRVSEAIRALQKDKERIFDDARNRIF